MGAEEAAAVLHGRRRRRWSGPGSRVVGGRKWFACPACAAAGRESYGYWDSYMCRSERFMHLAHAARGRLAYVRRNAAAAYIRARPRAATSVMHTCSLATSPNPSDPSSSVTARRSTSLRVKHSGESWPFRPLAAAFMGRGTSRTRPRTPSSRSPERRNLAAERKEKEKNTPTHTKHATQPPHVN